MGGAADHCKQVKELEDFLFLVVGFHRDVNPDDVGVVKPKRKNSAQKYIASDVYDVTCGHVQVMLLYHAGCYFTTQVVLLYHECLY